MAYWGSKGNIHLQSALQSLRVARRAERVGTRHSHEKSVKWQLHSRSMDGNLCFMARYCSLKKSIQQEAVYLFDKFVQISTPAVNVSIKLIDKYI